MLAPTLAALLFGAGLCVASPLNPRAVQLDPAATAEAQPRDDTATRALSGIAIKTNSGQCLFVESGSGDFRENLIPVKTANCDGSPGQKWDVITKGRHNDRQDQALIVSTLIQGCLNFDPRRAAGNQVLLFSCGGRADGSGQVTDSQVFPFTGCTGPLPLVPGNGGNTTCLTIKNGALDQTTCNIGQASGDELFTLGDVDSNAKPTASPATASTPSATASATTTSNAAAATTTTASSTPAPSAGADITVARAGGKLDPAAVAQAMKKDTTATRALTASPIKASNGQCLTVDATKGDFRENLIPITTETCNGSSGQMWDVISKGIHNDQAGFALLVSTLTSGCLNYDDRRAPGDQVILFSCGGRADGDGQVTDSQLFPFTAGTKQLALAPQSGKNATCLLVKDGKLDAGACSKGNDQLFTFS